MHFNIPIQQYLPWYSYEESGLSVPKVNDTLYKIFVNAIPEKYNILCNLWFKPDLEYGYYIIPIESWSSKTINVDLNSKIGSISLKDESIKFSFSNWIEIEKVRLFYHLGIIDKALSYLSIVNQIEKLMDITEYYRINILEDNESNIENEFFIRISNFGDMINRGNIIKRIDESEINGFISKYKGESKFGRSLKTYLEDKGTLTQSQISKSCELFQEEYMRDNRDKVCVIISGDESFNDDVKSLSHRLLIEGYTINHTNNDTVIYLL